MLAHDVCAPAKVLSVRGWQAKRRCRVECVPVVTEKHTEFGVANPHRTLQHRLKHGFQLARRRTHDAQHFRCGRLLFQRLAQFVQ
jgi:hypothetical protein